MKLTQLLSALALVATAIASPSAMLERSQQRPDIANRLAPRDANASNMSNVDILNYLLTLELIQDALYGQGLLNSSQYDFLNAGYSGPFLTNLKQMSAQSSAQVLLLTNTLKGLGAPVTVSCDYAWPSIEGSVGFVNLANIIGGWSILSPVPMHKTLISSLPSHSFISTRH